MCMNAIMSTFTGREDLVVEQAVSTFLRRIVLNCEYCKERLKLDILRTQLRNNRHNAMNLRRLDERVDEHWEGKRNGNCNRLNKLVQTRATRNAQRMREFST